MQTGHGRILSLPAALRAYAMTPMLFLCGVSALAVAPSPSLLDMQAQLSPGQSPVIPNFAAMHERGICTPDSFFAAALTDVAHRSSSAQQSPTASAFKVLAILVKFSDKNSQVLPTYFDSLVYAHAHSTVNDYFKEISYGAIDLVTVNLPSSLGWKTAPQTYNYYVQDLNAANNPDYGLGDYPHNSQKLVEDLVDLVDPSVDFSQYDNNHDGYVDVLLVIHAGSGAELTGNTNDMWSHKWGITPRSKDGVLISSYTVQPEYWHVPNDMTIGVYSHELCHGFGLPDLYDTDNSSNGVGKWDIMAVGSWNGPFGLGESPSHPGAWSRINMGFATAQNVTTNLISQPIAQVNTGGQIFRLWTSGLLSNEYFLVENRQKTGYDSYIPQGGLLIWHIDDSKTTNQQEWFPGNPTANHYKVALEQADGLYELEHRTNSGNASDPFPGSLNRTSFNGATSPNSNAYQTGATFVAVNNISPSSPVMTADLIVGISAGVNDETNLPASFALHQNYPNPFNPATTLSFDLQKPGSVTLTIYNPLGEVVTRLIHQDMGTGSQSVVWNGTDSQGKPVGSGVYLASLTVDTDVQSVKMILIK